MPAAISITRLDYTPAELRREAKHTDDADAARRMLALALRQSRPNSSEARGNWDGLFNNRLPVNVP
jgi:hypothetical protein